MGVYCKKTRGGESRWYIEYRVDGRKVRECVGSSKKAAEKALAIRRAEILQGRYSLKRELKSPVLSDFAREYLEYSKANKKESSFKRDITSLNQLLPVLGSNRLNKITPFMIERYKQERLKRAKGATINRDLACLKRMFNLAIKWGKVSYNPVREVKFFKEEPYKERILCEEETERLLSQCKGPAYGIVLTALNTGMRLREILDLTWDNVDCITGFITVAHSKSGRIRKIPLNTVLWRYLRGLPRYNEYVFPCPKTLTPYRTFGFRSIFQRAMKRAGIRNCRFHDLRHTFATRLASRNVDLPTIQELLGHSTLNMVKRYAHPTAEHKKRAVELLTRTGTGQDTLTTREESESAHFLPTRENSGRGARTAGLANTLYFNRL